MLYISLSIHTFLIKLNSILFIALFAGVNFFKVLLFTIVGNYYQFQVEAPDVSLLEEFILVALVGPLIETLLFQYLLQSVLLPLFINNLKFNVFLTAILFGLTHFDNWLHVVSASLGGLLYGYAYVLSTAKMTFPFVTVLVIHSLSNALLFVLYRLI